MIRLIRFLGRSCTSPAVLLAAIISFAPPAYAAVAVDSFNPSITGVINSLAVQPDGKIVIGGDFTSVNGTVRNYVARLEQNGILDAGFDPNLDGKVNTIAIQSDGKIVIGGYFTTIQGVSRRYIARLNNDGTLDAGFSPDPDNWVSSIAIQPDGNILLGGPFDTVKGQSQNSVARLNPDGTLDGSLINNPALVPQVAVLSLAVQPDGKILIIQRHNSIGRLNADGSTDTGFAPQIVYVASAEEIYTLAVQADEKILIGGLFGTVDGQPRTGLARLNKDGTVDAIFNPDLSLNNTDTYVSSMALQADGKMIIAGFFSLDHQTEMVLARLNKDGSVDTAFNTDVYGGVAFTVIQPDGNVLLTGNFTAVDGESRKGIARLINTEPAVQQLTVAPDGSSAAWMRDKTSPEISSVEFMRSDNGTNWVSLGKASRISGGWEITGLSLPASGNFSLRAFGYEVENQLRSTSCSLIEQIKLFNLATPDAAIEAVEKLQQAFETLDASSFKNANMQNALINKLNASIEAIKGGAYAEALNQLQNDLLGKTDGCAKSGAVDKNDWIMNCGSQEKIYPLVLEAIQYTRNLM